jgi:hypothetical protein
MRFCLNILLFMILAVPLTSTQLIAQEQDIIGVYFDEEAVTSIYETTGPAEDVEVWVAVKNMSATADFLALNFWLDANGDCVSAISLLGGAQNPGECGMFILGASPPIPRRDLILICRTGFLVTSPSERIDLYIRAIPDIPDPSPVYLTIEQEVFDLTPSSGSFTDPVAIINPDGVLEHSGSTWGGIKELYGK